MPNDPEPEEEPADPSEGHEVREAFDRLNRQMRDIAAQVTPGEVQRAMDEIEELRESEGYVE